MSQELLTEIVKALQAAYANGGIVVVLGVVLTYVVRVYRAKAIQGLLPPRARWKAWPKWARYLVPFAFAFAGALVIKVAGGVGWAVAIVGAVSAAAVSIGTHKGAKLALVGGGKGSEPKPLDFAPLPDTAVRLDPHDFGERHGPPQ